MKIVSNEFGLIRPAANTSFKYLDTYSGLVQSLT